jgi:hypothetical protein
MKLCLVFLITMSIVESSFSFQTFSLKNLNIPSLPSLVRSSDHSLSSRYNPIRLKSKVDGSLFVSKRSQVILSGMIVGNFPLNKKLRCICRVQGHGKSVP